MNWLRGSICPRIAAQHQYADIAEHSESHDGLDTVANPAIVKTILPKPILF